MRTWHLLGASVIGAVIVWFILTDPSENEVLWSEPTNEEIRRAFIR